MLVAVLVAALLVPGTGERDVHTIIEAVSTVLAVFVGCLGLVRYHARRHVPYLVLGVGFLGVALLDLNHAVSTSRWFTDLWPSPPSSLAPWSWFAGRFFLGVVAVVFWRTWTEEDISRGTDEWMVYGGVMALTIACFLLFAFVPLPAAHWGWIGRPQELLVLVLFLVALVGLWRRGYWRSSLFHHWVNVALMVSVATQATMVFSEAIMDGPFDLAHGLKIVSYTLVLMGFLADLFHLHRRAEADASRAELARAAADAAHAASERRAKQLEQSEARYRALVEGAGVAIWDEDLTALKERLDRIMAGGVTDLGSYLRGSPELVSDLASVIQVNAISHETLRMYGAETPEEFFDNLGKVFGPEYRDVFVDELVAMARGDHTIEGEALTRTLDGRTLWVSKKIRLFQTDQQLRGVMSLTDVSSIKAAEDQLRARTGELARSNAELDDFAYIASHDLKEPLRGISNFAHFLLEDHSEELSDDAEEKIHTLIRLARRMERQIQSLLEYSRAARAEPERSAVNMNDLVAEALDSLQTMEGMEQTELRVARDLPTVRADRELTERILTNLISNAIKYNDKNERWLEIGWFDEGSAAALEDPRAPVFYVRDNGIGIREKHIESVFRIFKRLHGREQFGGGAGAGLTIVKKIVEAQNGRIWVESEPDEGTTFYFTIGGSLRSQAAPSLVGAAGT